MSDIQTATILSKKSFDELGLENKIRKISIKLMGPGRKELKTIGKVKCEVENQGMKTKFKMYVVDTSENLLCRPAIEELQIMEWENDKIKMHANAEVNSIEQDIKEISDSEFKDYITKQYSNLFKGVGKIKNFQYNIQINRDAQP
ncbi:hypothetical protein QE152_g10388 [Popillia japonica]|uniref:Uncharacterized protein n=1 Tax=Popillia japonica TaxID=7064 RepID=A0AAW1LVJ9_POPJA